MSEGQVTRPETEEALRLAREEPTTVYKLADGTVLRENTALRADYAIVCAALLAAEERERQKDAKIKRLRKEQRGTLLESDERGERLNEQSAEIAQVKEDRDRCCRMLIDVEGSILSYCTDIPEAECERLRVTIRHVLETLPSVDADLRAADWRR